MSMQQQKYIIPLTDFGIRHIFDTEPNYELLLDFVNALHGDSKTYETPIDQTAIFDDIFSLTFIHLDLPEFTKTESELETHLDKWFYAFENIPELDSCPAKLSEKIFIQLFEAAEIDKLTPEEYTAYQRSVKHFRDMRNIVNTARKDAIASVGG